MNHEWKQIDRPTKNIWWDYFQCDFCKIYLAQAKEYDVYPYNKLTYSFESNFNSILVLNGNSCGEALLIDIIK